MTNKQIAQLLRKAASAVEHGRHATARKAIIEAAFQVLSDPVAAMMARANADSDDDYEPTNYFNGEGMVIRRL